MASILNASGLSAEKKTDTSKEKNSDGVFGILNAMLFRRSLARGKTQSSKNINEQENGKKNGEATDNPSDPTEEGETFTTPLLSTTPTQTMPPPRRDLVPSERLLPRPTVAPGDLSKKRKRDPRPDPYDIQLSPRGSSSEVEEPQEKLNKSLKSGIKTEQPVMQPERSNGHGSTIAPHRQTRSKTASIEPEAAEAPVTNGRGSALDDNENEPQPLKARRGRPRKHKPQVVSHNDPPEMPTLSEELVDDAVDPKIVPGRSAELNNDVPHFAGHRFSADEDEEDIVPILMNPSPLKPILPQPKDVSQESTAKGKGRAEARNKAHPKRNHNSINMSLSEDEIDIEDGDEDEGEDIADDQSLERESRQGAEPRGSQILINIEMLKQMLSKAKRVGCTFDRKRKIWVRRKKEEAIKSAGGNRLDRRVKRLTVMYGMTCDCRKAGDFDKMKEFQKQITDLVFGGITEAAESISTTTLGSEADAKSGQDSPTETLTDFYFLILPNLVSALKSGVEAHTLEVRLRTDAIQELIQLLDIIYNLGEAALRQPTDVQPNSPQNKTYQVSQPTRLVLPMARTLRKDLKMELSCRKLETESSQRAQIQQERASERHMEEERILGERRRRKQEIIRQQKEDWAAKVADRKWGTFLRAQVAAEDAKAAARRAEMDAERPRPHGINSRELRTSEVRGFEEGDTDEMEEDPSGDEDLERVSVFGKNNSQKVTGPRPWTNDEKAVFIDMMRFRQGEWLLRYPASDQD